MIKAIETRYAGCRFRSRLEARWAVFFTTAGIPWEYEPEGFVIDGQRYLPDFFLPECGTWIEVKGEMPSASTMKMLASAAQQLPTPWQAPPSPYIKGEKGPALMLVGPIPDLKLHWNDYLDLSWEAIGSYRHGFGMYPKNRRPWWMFTESGESEQLHVFDRDEYMYPEIAEAYLAARAARFEHGERG